MEQQERLHALDAVRAYALLLGIVFHATMSFIPTLAIAGWPINDNAPSETLSATFFVLHIFRMTTFFVMAGFFARLVVYRKGLPAFVQDRRKRILVPFLISWPVTMALMSGAMIWAIFKAGKSLTMTPPPPTGEHVLIPFPLTHLWFLYVLLLLYVAVLGLRWAANSALDRNGNIRGAIDRWLVKLTDIPVAPIVLAAPLAIVLFSTQWWTLWTGIPTPDNSLIPNLAAFVGYGTAMLVGWFLHRQMQVLKTLERYWMGYFAVAVALTVLCYTMVGMPTTPVKLEPAMRVLYAGAYCVAIWCWTFAIIGAAMKYLASENPRRRYLADASYWMYIMHLPIVLAMQALVLQWPLHWSIKFALILAVTFALLLLSYHYWVRPTFIGERLNGRRYPRGGSQPSHPLPEELPLESGDVLASLRGARKNYGAIKALNGIDLEVRHGELLAVLGPNGAGKSTAIALLLGLQQPDSGTARLFGQLPNEVTARRQVGIMMQEVALASELKVREHIDLVSSYYPSPYDVRETLRHVGIEALADRPYRALSGGQKRQVQFALAICGRPQLLFLDEPTVGLDIRARERMWEAIRALVQQGCSIVLTTHYLEEAEALADRVAVINKGQVIASGTVAEMRAIVSRKRISCITRCSPTELAQWEGVDAIVEIEGRVSITTANAESLVRRLLAADTQLAELEVRRAGLSDAFSELTQEAP